MKKNEPNEIRNRLSELQQLPSSDTVSQSAPEEGEHDTTELRMIKDGARITNGTLSTEAGDRILEALANSKHTFARGFLRSENPHESAAKLRTLGYFTPSFVGDPELVRCMIRNGFRFDEPDPSLSGIDQFRMDGQLKILNRYLAISDPVYISALFLEDTTEAPVVRLFHLERTLRDFAAKDHEFTTEYDALRRRCEEFGVSLLDQCRDKHEVQCTLDSAVGKECNQGRTFPLDILHQAIIDGNAEVGFGSLRWLGFGKDKATKVRVAFLAFLVLALFKCRSALETSHCFFRLMWSVFRASNRNFLFRRQWLFDEFSSFCRHWWHSAF